MLRWPPVRHLAHHVGRRHVTIWRVHILERHERGLAHADLRRDRETPTLIGRVEFDRTVAVGRERYGYRRLWLMARVVEGRSHKPISYTNCPEQTLAHARIEHAFNRSGALGVNPDRTIP